MSGTESRDHRWLPLRALRVLTVAAGLVGGGACALLLALWWGQERLLFAPMPLPPDHRFGLGPDVHEVWIDVPGARLNALHLRLADPRGVVFFLHGNAGNLQTWFTAPDFYRQANLDLFMIDYRGYGKSSGRIQSQAQLEDDVRAAWSTIEHLYQGKRRIVYGRSLGTGLAATLAAQVQPELTVLVSPYENMVALAAEHYPWVPSALLRYPLRTDHALARIRSPVWMAHGDLDKVIPVEHAVRLASRSPKATLVRVPAAGHNDIQLFEAYLGPLRAALKG
jgi:uncharacterized protein